MHCTLAIMCTCEVSLHVLPFILEQFLAFCHLTPSVRRQNNMLDGGSKSTLNAQHKLLDSAHLNAGMLTWKTVHTGYSHVANLYVFE